MLYTYSMLCQFLLPLITNAAHLYFDPCVFPVSIATSNAGMTTQCALLLLLISYVTLSCQYYIFIEIASNAASNELSNSQAHTATNTGENEVLANAFDFVHVALSRIVQSVCS